jgi:hypothetical protein
MSTSALQAAELKYNLVDKLIAVRDINILQKINDLIGDIDADAPVFKTTIAQREMLAHSEEDIRNGRVISDEDLNAEEDKWLSA